MYTRVTSPRDIAGTLRSHFTLKEKCVYTRVTSPRDIAVTLRSHFTLKEKCVYTRVTSPKDIAGTLRSHFTLKEKCVYTRVTSPRDIAGNICTCGCRCTKSVFLAVLDYTKQRLVADVRILRKTRFQVIYTSSPTCSIPFHLP